MLLNSLNKSTSFTCARVLVTSNAYVANRFADNLYKYPARTVYDSLTKEDKQSILIDPYDQRSYNKFQSLEYSLGYSDSSDSAGDGENNFQIVLTVKDLNDNFESFFVDKMIDFVAAKKVLEDYNNQLNSQLKQIKSERAEQGLRLEDPVEFDQDILANANKISYNFVKRNFYFIFINRRDIYLSPIISQFYASDVSQSSSSELPSIRYIKLKFICTGHPNLLSKLASLKYYDSQFLSNRLNKSTINKIKTSVAKNIRLSELNNDSKKLDFTIKKILLDLFNQITGKEVILVLPDFGKIFEGYKKTKVLNQLNNNLTAVSNSTNATLTMDNRSKYGILISFLETLGFNIFELGGRQGVESFITQLDPDDKKLLKAFQKRLEENIEKLASSSNLTEFINELVRDIKDENNILYLTDSERDSIYTGTDLAQREFLINTRGLFSGGNDSSTEYVSVVSQLQELRPTTRTPPAGGRYSPDVLKNEVAQILRVMYEARLGTLAKNYNKTYDYITSKGVVKNNASEEAVTNVDYDPNQDESLADLNFTISSDEPSLAGGAKVKNEIDYNEFANNFSKRLQVVAESSDFNNFNISYTEENSLSRLNILKDTVLFDGNPCVKDPFSPCIVIFDQWLFNNFYCPLHGTTRNDFGSYPISEEDRVNYQKNSKYYKALITEKENNPFIINGFLEPFDSPVRIFQTPNSSKSNNLLTANFSTDLAVATLEKISPTFAKKRSENLQGVNLFTYAANAGNARASRYNILEYDLKTDTLNAYASYNSQLQYLNNSITNEALLPRKVDSLTRVLGKKTFDELQLEIEKYYNPNSSIAFSELAQSTSGSFEKRFPLPTEQDIINGSDVQNNDIIKDLIKYFGNQNDLIMLEKPKEFKEDGIQKGELQYAEQVVSYLKSLRDRAARKALDILLSFKFRSLNGNYKSIDTEYVSNPFNRSAELFNLIFNKIYTLQIKTFATFQINNIAQVNFPAAVMIYNKSNNIYGSLMPLMKQLSPITGMYRIVGFKHTIVSTAGKNGNTFSEFVLVKDINVGSIP